MVVKRPMTYLVWPETEGLYALSPFHTLTLAQAGPGRGAMLNITSELLPQTPWAAALDGRGA
jgi:hypothetical protein